MAMRRAALLVILALSGAHAQPCRGDACASGAEEGDAISMIQMGVRKDQALKRVLVKDAAVTAQKKQGPDSSCSAGKGSFVLDLTYSKHPDTVTVPEVPTTPLSLYAYATENALVAIPAKCFEENKKELQATASNMADRTGEFKGSYYFRISTAKEYDIVKGMTSCACGFVLELHGTGGVTWETASYAAMMAGMGYVVVLPDSQSQPDSMDMKGKAPVKKTADIDTSNQCGEYNPYDGKKKCRSFKKPFCYSTKIENILGDPAGYRKYVERNSLIRQLELDYFVENQAALLSAGWGKVFLLGRSEGAAVAARYHNAALDALLSGRIIVSYSCEWNYFTSCAENAKICGDKCKKDTPQLNLIGERDYYFGNVAHSISRKAADAENGYGGPITGNCRKAYNDQEFTKATVVVFPGVSHGLAYSHGNALRSILGDFLATPTAPASDWKSLTRKGCSEKDGIHKCDAEAGEKGEKPCIKYKVNTNAPWVFSGANKIDTCTA